MSLVVVFGGAGFIGLHTVRELLKRGYDVRVCDKFLKPPHTMVPSKDSWHQMTGGEVELIVGDMAQRDCMTKALEGADFVINLAAKVGIGQSMYEVREYTEENTLSASTMWEAIIRSNEDIKSVVQASTMSLYGEGRYRCPDCGIVFPEMRPSPSHKDGWDPVCPKCGGAGLIPEPTEEGDPLKPTSTYALTKMYQEKIALLMGRTYGIHTSALRYFNVIGPGQSLSNPYTGVWTIFYSALRAGRKATIFEDGLQSRDFIYVGDVARANVAAMERGVGGVYNVGTGDRWTVLRVAETLASKMGIEPEGAFEITGRFRKGDVRHIFASTKKAREELDFRPGVSLDEGVERFLEWAESCESGYNERAYAELTKYNLLE